MSRQVFLLGNEVSRIIEIPPLTQSTGEVGQVTRNDIPSFIAENSTGFWDPLAQNSPFFNGDPSNFDVEIKKDGKTIFEGKIKNINSNNAARTAEVTLRSGLQILLERGIIYVSVVKETPADAVKNIASLYKIPVNASSFAAANVAYDLNLVFVTVNLQKPEMTAMAAMQQLADIGNARIYSQNGVLNFDTSLPRTGVSIFTFSDDKKDRITLYSHPEMEIVEKDKSKGYRIETLRGAVSLGAEFEQSRSISAGPEAPIRIVSRQAGIYLGDRRVDYQQQFQRRITFDIPASVADELLLGMAVGLNYTSNNWKSQIMDISKIEPGSLTTSKITGLTR